MKASDHAFAVALIVPSLECGGAERVAVTLADALVRRGHAISLITLSGTADDFFPVPPGVQRIALNRQAVGTSVLRNGLTTLRQIVGLRKKLQGHFDVALSFMSATNIVTIIAAVGTGIPVVATEHSPRGLPPLGPIWGPLQRLAYRYADRVVSVSHAIDSGYVWVPVERRAVIYNPLGAGVMAACDEPQAGAQRTILGVGRLVSVKGFDVLLRAFARVAERRADWALVIVGDGPERAALERLRDSLGLRDRVRFPGVAPDVAKWLARADVFVSPTRTGGVGCAAIEALASGVPVIATIRPGTTAEVIHDEANGLRVGVDDVPGIAGAITRLIEDDALRQHLGAKGRLTADALGATSVAEVWERLFVSLFRETAIEPQIVS